MRRTEIPSPAVFSLALSRFLQRGTVPACKNRSAAPGCRCPNMRRGTRPACIFGRLPLLRLACFCRRQRLGSAAKHASLHRPQDALRRACPLGTKFPGEPRTRLTARTLPPENFPVGVRAVRACRPARTDFEIGSLSRKARGSFLFCARRVRGLRPAGPRPAGSFSITATPHGGAGGGSFAAQPVGFIYPPTRPLEVSPCRCATSPCRGTKPLPSPSPGGDAAAFGPAPCSSLQRKPRRSSSRPRQPFSLYWHCLSEKAPAA